MEKIPFEQARDAYVGIIEKITVVDPMRGAYLARHIILNEARGTVEYIGSKAILKSIKNKIKVKEV